MKAKFTKCDICKDTGLTIQLTKNEHPYYYVGTCSCETGSKVIQHTLSHVGKESDCFGNWHCDCNSPYRCVYYYWQRTPSL